MQPQDSSSNQQYEEQSISSESSDFQLMEQKYQSPLLKDDIAKRIFGTEQNKHILAKLLEYLLPDIKLQNGGDIQFLDTVIPPEEEDGKKIIYNILILYNKYYLVNIEFQNKDEGYYKQKSLFYLGKMISKQSIEGQQYYNIKQVIQINILNHGNNYLFICGRHTILRPQFENQIYQQNQYRKEYQLDNSVEAHYYLLGEYEKDDFSIEGLDEKEKRIAQIMRFLKYPYDKQDVSDDLQKFFKEILQELDYMTQRQQSNNIQQKQLYDYYTQELLNQNYQEGKQEGQIIGIICGMILCNQREIEQDQIQLIKNFLQNNQNLKSFICKELNIGYQQFNNMVEQIKQKEND